MKFLPGNAQHIGARRDQQDAFAFSDPGNREFVAHAGFLAVVADGMGGLANGREASALAVRTFLIEYERKGVSEPIPEAMMRACRAANGAVAGLNPPGESQTGSTLVAAVAHQHFLYWLSMGDSHLYLLRRSEVVQVNRDHNYGQRLLDTVARGEMSRGDAGNHPEREHLTSFLGMPGTTEVDHNHWPLRLEGDDYIILCTDGIYRAMNDAAFAKAFGSKPSVACEAIKRNVLAQQVQNQDNLTIVAIRCDDDAVRGPLFPSRMLAGAALLLLGLNVVAGVVAWRGLSEKPMPGKDRSSEPVDVTASPKVVPPDKVSPKSVTGDTSSGDPTGSNPKGPPLPRSVAPPPQVEPVLAAPQVDDPPTGPKEKVDEPNQVTPSSTKKPQQNHGAVPPTKVNILCLAQPFAEPVSVLRIGVALEVESDG